MLSGLLVRVVTSDGWLKEMAVRMFCDKHDIRPDGSAHISSVDDAEEALRDIR